MDRFSLLLLEPGEIYFEDFAVSLFQSEKHNESGLRGRFKICSKSFLFVPTSDWSLPILKFAFSEIHSIKEWVPKSFRDPLAGQKHVLVLQTSSRVEMLRKNIVAPFEFFSSPSPKSYFFALSYEKIDTFLPFLLQLVRSSTLTPTDQNSMIATIAYSRQRRFPFDTCALEFGMKETILFKTVGNKIRPLVVNPGRIVLTDRILYFQPFNNAETKPVLKIRLDYIQRIFRRRYLLRPLGLEMEYLNEKRKRERMYLTFAQPEDRNKLYHKLIAQEPLKLEDSCEENMTLQWVNGVISNYDYLIYLNSAADRSFNDLTQYPVMPWVLADYKSSELDLSNVETYRDLSKPIGALNEARLEGLKDRASDLPESSRFLYGSHYSTPGFVLYFLVRKIPECMLCFQNGKFDQPDRMFNSVPQTWINVTTHQSDFKELIPEFYNTEGNGDFLLNSKNVDFGTRYTGKRVGNVELPPWASSPKDFIFKLREALESDYVSAHLHEWIDLIFGFKQRGEEAFKANNIFYHLCYEGFVELDSIRDLEQRHSLEIQIGEFGQVPKQIFTSPHPQKKLKSVSSNYPSLAPILSRDNGYKQIIESKLEPKIWKNMSTIMTRVCDYQAHKEALTAVAISIDNLWIFSASHDSMLKMYSLEETHILRSISISNMTLSSCIPLPNNRTVLLGSWDNNICSYSIELGRISDFLSIHSDAISCMDWRSGVLATGSWDSLVKIWHCNEANGYKIGFSDLLAQLDHNSQVTSLHLCPDNSQIVTGTREGGVILWCLRSHSIIQELPSHRRCVNAVRFSPDSTRVISCGSDFYMKVIDLKTGTILFSKDLGEELNCLAWDGQTVLIGGGSGDVSIWDLQKVTFKTRFKAHKGPVKTLCVSSNGDHVVTGGDDRRVIVWKTR
ncbi:protein FAN [Lepeophtheirus salmonis]|uniref:protein FAN n=1 Tax=Lepeophtheirus salmonis TaxID=72036 RepID=UPI001AE2FEEA|nr:protein FAN-like [Lepeophtheirus salmonis]